MYIVMFHCALWLPTPSNFSAFSLQRALNSFKYKLVMFFPKDWASTQLQVKLVWAKSLMVILFPLKMITLGINICCQRGQ